MSDQDLILLSESEIKNKLNPDILVTAPQFHIFKSIHSTNEFLKTYASSKHWQVCLAESQLAGKGRLGRQWYSPYAENIYCSIRLPWLQPINQLGPLSLLSGLTIIDTLKQFVFEPKIFSIKWPNDVFAHQKKISGVLIETFHIKQQLMVIIGIGINVNSLTANESISQPWCSLRHIVKHYTDRNAIVAQLLNGLNADLNTYAKNGWQAFQTKWDEYDQLRNKPISISKAQDMVNGLAIGVNDQGLLKLKDKNNTIHFISSGEIIKK